MRTQLFAGKAVVEPTDKTTTIITIADRQLLRRMAADRGVPIAEIASEAIQLLWSKHDETN